MNTIKSNSSNLPGDSSLSTVITLDEAITHANDMAQKLHGTMCGDEHKQLAAWLTELRGNRNLPGDSSLPTVITRDEAIVRFETEVLPYVIEECEQDGQRDIPARSEAFNNWTDSLCKNGEISEWQYNNWTHPDSCEY